MFLMNTLILICTKELEPMNLLKMGYNITVFGFGFSGSGKTLLCWELMTNQMKVLTQQILKKFN